ncbi:DNA repair protein RecO [Marinobacter xestospongiae]|uniref:DNA repair protein RecO n=1 Tax=Marinobacter xestospongiae TaxID=994319 RepID=A0ABU3VST7_9GAMM|nr:DNA repair protein RecO [Marinobacter xestospongiae]MDV2077322.1 DNA repair protein RecO [Marinobacter xestospongiae]
MAAPVQGEPGYVLHRRPYRETSLLVDVLTLNHGRLGLVARGANSARSPLKAQLQPFQPLLLDWQGRSDLKTLVQLEVRDGPAPKGTVALYSGLYLNELLQRLVPEGDPLPELFACYIDSLHALADTTDVEPVLRRFEMAFAQALGYGFDWGWVTDLGREVEPRGYYCYDPGQGILAHPTPETRLQSLAGDTLLGLAAGDYGSADSRRLAKRVMRVLVDHLLQGRPLHSRSLFHKG